MKTSQAENLLNILNTFSNVKGHLGYVLAYNADKLEKELSVFLKFKNDLIVKYGEEKDGNYSLNGASENFPKFMEELTPLLDDDVDVDLKKVTEEDLENADLTMAQSRFIRSNFME